MMLAGRPHLSTGTKTGLDMWVFGDLGVLVSGRSYIVRSVIAARTVVRYL
jgi:hypothetical protein